MVFRLFPKVFTVASDKSLDSLESEHPRFEADDAITGRSKPCPSSSLEISKSYEGLVPGDRPYTAEDRRDVLKLSFWPQAGAAG